MDPYLFGKIAALEKLGLSVGGVLRAVTEEGVESLPKILSKMTPNEIEALRSYVTSGAAGGIRADIWKTQPDLAQRIETALKNIATPSDFDKLYEQWRRQNPVHPASKEQVRAAYERARSQRARSTSQTAQQRAEEHWNRNPGAYGPADAPPQYRSDYKPGEGLSNDYTGLVPAVAATALAAGLVGGPSAAYSGYGSAPTRWNVGRVIGHGMLGGLGGGLAGGTLGTLASLATRGRAAVPLILGGTAAGTLAGSYVGGRTQRPWYNR